MHLPEMHVKGSTKAEAESEFLEASSQLREGCSQLFEASPSGESQLFEASPASPWPSVSALALPLDLHLRVLCVQGRLMHCLEGSKGQKEGRSPGSRRSEWGSQERGRESERERERGVGAGVWRPGKRRARAERRGANTNIPKKTEHIKGIDCKALGEKIGSRGADPKTNKVSVFVLKIATNGSTRKCLDGTDLHLATMRGPRLDGARD